MDAELARGLRAIKTGIKRGEKSGFIIYSRDEPLTDDWVLHVYKILIPGLVVKVNNHRYHENTDEIRFGDPCGDLYYGQLLWKARFIKSLELLR